MDATGLLLGVWTPSGLQDSTPGTGPWRAFTRAVVGAFQMLSAGDDDICFPYKDDAHVEWRTGIEFVVEVRVSGMFARESLQIGAGAKALRRSRRGSTKAARRTFRRSHLRSAEADVSSLNPSVFLAGRSLRGHDSAPNRGEVKTSGTGRLATPVDWWTEAQESTNDPPADQALTSPDIAPWRHIAVGNRLATAIDFNSKSPSGIVTHVIVEARRHLETKPIRFHSGAVGLRSPMS